jgi:hypothetical protein
MVLWQSGLCSGLLNRTRWVRLPQAPPFLLQVRVTVTRRPHKAKLMVQLHDLHPFLSVIRLVAMAFRLGRNYRGCESLMADHF